MVLATCDEAPGKTVLALSADTVVTGRVESLVLILLGMSGDIVD